jgi:hypothetical protein
VLHVDISHTPAGKSAIEGELPFMAYQLSVSTMLIELPTRVLGELTQQLTLCAV